jgi:hypothetical protein
MKRVCLLLIAVFIANFTFSQEDGDLKNRFYFRGGLSIPTWKYGGEDGKDDFPDDTKRGGAVFELGSIFMLNSLKLVDGMRIGINVDYLSLSYHSMKSNDYDAARTALFFGSKIGPSFTYSPVDKLAFDTYIKFNPVWIASVVDDSYGDEDPDVYMGFFGTKLSAGFNIRYSILMIGFEYNPGSAKLKWIDEDAEDDDYLGNADDDGDKTPMPGYNITFGLSF